MKNRYTLWRKLRYEYKHDTLFYALLMATAFVLAVTVIALVIHGGTC